MDLFISFFKKTFLQVIVKIKTVFRLKYFRIFFYDKLLSGNIFGERWFTIVVREFFTTIFEKIKQKTFLFLWQTIFFLFNRFNLQNFRNGHLQFMKIDKLCNFITFLSRYNYFCLKKM